MSATATLAFIGGSADLRAPLEAGLVGAKAAELWQVTQLGLPVPPAFVLPTTLCAPVSAGQPAALESLRQGLTQGVAWLESCTGRRFADSRAPLLVSVRSGAAISMPGMLQTVLNIGLNDDSVRGLIRLSGNPRLAFDCYRRLIEGYAEVVEALPVLGLRGRLTDMIRSEGVRDEADLDPEALERLTGEYREQLLRQGGRPVPEEPGEQLYRAALAVYASWNSPRARDYRRLNRVPGLAGTAVTVQAMVFGNAGADSGSGVAFSRNPASGAAEPYVDFLFDAQGEDVVSGRRTPRDLAALRARLPEVARQLESGVQRIELERRDAQDVEFTVERGQLYFLQTRTAKRSPRAALRIAADLVHEGRIDIETALGRVADIDPELAAVSHFSTPAAALATATAASPGVACGHASLDSQRAAEQAAGGEPVILLRPDISASDLPGITASAGLLTSAGGRTAHAAVLARQLGKACLVGCGALLVDAQRREATLAGSAIREGDWVWLDGQSGETGLGRRAIVNEPPPELAEIERWRAARRPSHHPV